MITSFHYLLVILFHFAVINHSVIWNIDTMAGSGNDASVGGRASSASLKFPRSIWQDSSGTFYVVENTGNYVRKISGANNIVGRFVGANDPTGSFSGDGGQASAATMFYPISVVTDTAGRVYITDFKNNRVRRVATNGIITTILGWFTVLFSNHF